MYQNDHGQPARGINNDRVMRRSIDELVGLCKGVIADGVVVQGEAEFLIEWMERNRQAANQWPADVLYKRLRTVMEDGVLDDEEGRELLGLLHDITGGVVPDLDDSSGSNATLLPLDKPAPRVVFEDRLFCFTGKCCHGTRKECESEVMARGGDVKSSPTKGLHYLVIGVIGSRDWIHSTHGNKIQTAMMNRDEFGLPTAILSERHWAESLAYTGSAG